MAKSKQVKTEATLEVQELRKGAMTVWLRGIAPLLCNRLAAKARRELLFPKGRKDTATRSTTLKHDPINEFVDSMSLRRGNGPTRVVFPYTAVKGAIAGAALEVEGTNKRQLGRLVWVEGEEGGEMYGDLYGVPELFMAVVRSADTNKTPDIRTRAMIKEWCMQITVKFVKPQINEKVMMALLANAGIIMGIGDFRNEKGKGTCGQFEIVQKADCKDIIKAGGIKQQDAAIKDPQCADADTEELLSWFLEEVEQRGKQDLLTNGRMSVATPV